MIVIVVGGGVIIIVERPATQKTIRMMSDK